MYLSTTDVDYVNENRNIITSMLRLYHSLSGKRWPPYNRDLENEYGSAEAWHMALLRAIEEEERKKAG